MGAFFHAVAVFFDHLAAVQWGRSGSRSRCHVVKLALPRPRVAEHPPRVVPGDRLKFRAALGAYVAGVGVNSIAPARGGDLVKLYLVKHRIEDATYPTLALDARRRDALRLRRRRRADDLGALDRRAADAPGLLAAPDRRLEVLPAPRAARRLIGLAVLAARGVIVLVFWARSRVERLPRAACGSGFAILGDRARVRRSA